MSDAFSILFALLYHTFLGLLLARQILKLRYWVIDGPKDRDESTAYGRIETEYCEPFVPSAMLVGPSQDERIRSAYRGVLFGAIAPWYLLISWGAGSAGHHGAAFFLFVLVAAALAASLQQFWTYLRWQAAPGWVQSVEFKEDHLIVVTDYGERNVYVYDGTLQVLVSLEQDAVGVWPLRLLHRTEIVLSIKDGSGMATFPFKGQGCGQFLALCRRAGAKVDVLADTPIQKTFAMFAGRVDPCWIAPPTKQNSRSRGTFRDMVCSGCGAKTAVPSQGANKSCEYCGSADQTPA